MFRAAALLFSVALGCGKTVLAGEPPAPDIPPDISPSGSVLAVHVRGIALPNGDMWYEIDPGPLATRAVRMYSEPSHTRIAMVVDPDYKNSPEGQAWMASLADDRLDEVAYATGSLPDAHLRFQVTPPPASDNRIWVWVNGNFFGLDEDRLVAEQFLGSMREFGSSTYFSPPGDTNNAE
jgi:hypothetical protein